MPDEGDVEAGTEEGIEPVLLPLVAFARPEVDHRRPGLDGDGCELRGARVWGTAG